MQWKTIVAGYLTDEVRSANEGSGSVILVQIHDAGRAWVCPSQRLVYLYYSENLPTDRSLATWYLMINSRQCR